MKRVSRIGENIGPRIPSKLLNEDTEELNLHCNHVSTLLIHHNSNNRLSLRELNLSSNKLGYEGGNRRHDSTKYVNLLVSKQSEVVFVSFPNVSSSTCSCTDTQAHNNSKLVSL